MTDVLVVGGGLIGLLTARALRHRGADVTLCERASTGREASWAGGGILSPLYPWRLPDAVNRLAAASQAQWPDLAAELLDRTGIDPGYREGGMLTVDDDDPGEVLAWAQRLGVSLEVLPAEELARFEPGAVTHARHLFSMPAVASIRNPRLLRAVRGIAVGEGVRIREQAPVRRIHVVDGHVRAVEVGDERITADHVVVCAGAWSGELLRPLDETLPPIEPLRGQMLLYAAEPGTLEHVLLSRDRYLIPRKDGCILAGSTVEQVGFDSDTTERARLELNEFACSLLPALREVPIAEHWAGLRPATPDGVPLIGAHPRISGLWVNAGHFRNGIVTAPASAQLLADLFAGATPRVDPAPCAWPD